MKTVHHSQLPTNILAFVSRKNISQEMTIGEIDQNIDMEVLTSADPMYIVLEYTRSNQNSRIKVQIQIGKIIYPKPEGRVSQCHLAIDFVDYTSILYITFQKRCQISSEGVRKHTCIMSVAFTKICLDHLDGRPLS